MSTRDTHPNVVVVSIDSLRADHCGFLGDDRGLTPQMDALADGGVTFTNAIAPGPQTFSSMPAAFTGHQRRPGDIPEDDRSFWERRLAAIDAHCRRYGTLAERLQDLGYTTVGFSPNPWTSSNAGFDRGFDRFTDLSAPDEGGTLARIGRRLPGIDADGRALELADNVLSGDSFFARWESFYDSLLSTRAALSEPYFLWVFAMDTHYPFIAGRAHREETSLLRTYTSTLRSRAAMGGDADDLSPSVATAVERSYRDTVRAVDAFVGRLQADLAADDPALFVHADHGESLGEHDAYGHDHRNVYEENVHVPYFAHNVGRSTTVESPTSLATLYDAVVATGRSGTFDPDAQATNRVVARSECGTRRTLRGPRFKYVEHGDEELLFDLQADPAEQTDLSGDSPPPRCEYRASLDQFEEHGDETHRLARAGSAVAARGGF